MKLVLKSSCRVGTGKTRVGFHVAMEVCKPRGLVLVMVPSIGLVRQLRGDYINLSKENGIYIKLLSVCSDETAGAGITPDVENELAEQEHRDPTRDTGMVGSLEVTGDVARNTIEVESWLKSTRAFEGMRVIVSTYQSGHHTGEGLHRASCRAEILIADEAHRTAGIRKVKGKKRNERLRQFIACHDNSLIPARRRLYMTATPRSFNVEEQQTAKPEDFVVAPMRKEAIFGEEVLPRLSYREAVENGFLSDYKIVAVALPASAYETADKMAMERTIAGREGRSATTSLALRKLAYGLALAGGIPKSEGGTIPMTSSIAFLNRVEHSRDMVGELSDKLAQEWLEEHLKRVSPNASPRPFDIHHRDASHSTDDRSEVLTKLRNANQDKPVGVSNVGIFGEGIDTPSLSGIAFIEPRRSPVDVIQAVGRAMRLSPNKEYGVILVPLEIPPGRDAEAWLESRQSTEGWNELAQILQALRAHDGRIEDRLGDLLDIYIVDGEDEEIANLVVIKEELGSTSKSFVWTGLQSKFEDALVPGTGKQKSNEKATQRLRRVGTLTPVETVGTLTTPAAACYGIDDRNPSRRRLSPFDVEDQWKANDDSRFDPIAPAEKVENLLDLSIRYKGGYRLRSPQKAKGSSKSKSTQQSSTRLLDGLSDDEGRGEAIRLRLLEKSGLRAGPERDVNILRNTVEYTATLLREDGLEDGLRTRLGMTNLAPPRKGRMRADACTVACLLWLTAAIVHERLERGGGLMGSSIESIATPGMDPVRLLEAWDDVLIIDYHPIFKEARDLLRHVIIVQRKTRAVGEAISKILADAQEIGESYARMEMDHAGELFNEVMGDQAADGAYFTRPHAAVVLAGLVVSCLGEQNWLSEETWRQCRAFDPACGSATLLTAYLAALKAKAKSHGADSRTLQDLHRFGIESMLVGLDINPVSLQLAGAQLTLGDAKVHYDKMNLVKMPYGGEEGSAGSLELLTDSRVIHSKAGPGQATLELESKAQGDATRLKPTEHKPSEREDLTKVVDMILGSRVALMNPPFVNRAKLGSKFTPEIQSQLRERIDGAQDLLESTDPAMKGIVPSRTTAAPLFVALGLKSISQENGVFGTIKPTTSLLSPNGLRERKILAQSLHIAYIVTSHEIGNSHMSQTGGGGGGINESLIVGTYAGRDNNRLRTTFVSLDHQPRDRQEAERLVEAITNSETIPNGESWTIASSQLRSGDWSGAGFRNGGLDLARRSILKWKELIAIRHTQDVSIVAPGDGAFAKPEGNEIAHLKVFASKAERDHQRLLGQEDSSVVIKAARVRKHRERDAYVKGRLDAWDQIRSNLLINTGQNPSSGRVNAVTCPHKALGTVWKPVQGISLSVAKAWTIWLNSTVGRLLMAAQRGGDGLGWPNWNPEGLKNILMPKPENTIAIEVLESIWEETCNEIVPQYRDGYTKIKETLGLCGSLSLSRNRRADLTRLGRIVSARTVGVWTERNLVT